MKTILSILVGLVGLVGMASTLVFVKYNDYARAARLDPNDSLALVALYDATNGAQWKNNWDLSTPVRTWYGVVLDASGQKVIKLELDNNGLDGYLPEAIGRLEGLVSLRMPRNALKNHLPDSLTMLGNLRKLILYDNQLDGGLPDSMQRMVSLKMISLTDNQLDAPLPASLGELSQLEVLLLGENNIPGEIPDSFVRLVSLRTCNLTDNQLTGNLPEQLGKMTALQELLLSNNAFNGQVPESISDLKELRYLWLDYNNFIDTFPSIQLPELLSLRLGYNRFNGIPDLTSMPKLYNPSPNGVSVVHNQLSFEDILPNLPLEDSTSQFDYWPQDTIVIRDTFYLKVGEVFSYKLPFDDTVSTNTYIWYKYKVQKEITRTNEFAIPSVRFSDEGSYRCVVTNSRLDSISLFAYAFTLVIKGNSGCGDPPPADECYLADVQCSLNTLNGYCAQHDRDRPREVFSFCGALMSLTDRDWFAFKAGAEHVRIRLTPFGCTDVPGSGIVAFVFDDCGLGTPLNCDTSCTRSTMELDLDSLTIGKDYYLLVGGCEGGCFYQIDIKEGGEGTQLVEPGRIIGRDSVCSQSDFYDYTLEQSIPGAIKYEWTIADEDPVYTLNPKLNTQWPETGIFQLCVRGIGRCDTTEYSCRTIEVFSELKYEQLLIEVVQDNGKYYVEFRIAGGVAPYVISGSGGTFNVVNRTFTSDLIDCGRPYNITVTDGNGCFFNLSGVEYCNCITEAGTLFGDKTNNVCEGSPFKVFHNNDAVLDTNDTGVFVWYEMVKAGSFSNIVEISDNGVFHYNDQLVALNKPYRVQYVVANKTANGGIDWLDPCLDTTPAFIVYYRARPEANAGADTTVCFGGFNLNATFSSTGSTGRWRFISGPDTPHILNYKSPVTKVNVITPGKYYFLWLEIQSDCPDGDTVAVEVLPPLDFDVMGVKAICEGVESELEVTSAFSKYLWSTGETTARITVAKPGFYGVTVTDDSGCTASKTIEVKSKVGPKPIVLGSSTACTGDTVVLSLNKSFVAYRWSDGSTGPSTRVTTGGVYCVTVTDEDGCMGDDCTQVDFKASTTFIQSLALCFGDSITVGANVIKKEGHYEITLPHANRNGCDSVVILDVEVFPEIVLEDTLIVHDNGGDDGLINVQITGGKPPYTYKWSNGSTSPFVKNLRKGSYSLTVTDANGCSQMFMFAIKDISAAKTLKNPLGLDLKLYPSIIARGVPAFLTYRANAPVKLDIFMHDFEGKMVFRSPLLAQPAPSTFLIPTSVQSGVYLISVRSKNHTLGVWRLIIFR